MGSPKGLDASAALKGLDYVMQLYTLDWIVIAISLAICFVPALFLGAGRAAHL